MGRYSAIAVTPALAGSEFDLSADLPDLSAIGREFAGTAMLPAQPLHLEGRLEIGGRVRTISINEADKRVRALVAPQDRLPQLKMKLEAAERSTRTGSGSLDVDSGVISGRYFHSALR